MDVSSRLGVLRLRFCVFLLVCCSTASANVVLIGHNVTLSFDSIEANFAPAVKGSGECGVLYQAEPLDACSSLMNRVDHHSNVTSPYVLIVRGACSFEEKVRRAQKSGFKAAIVFDYEDDGPLVAMAGNSAGIKIHAVFISKESGDMLKKYIDNTDVELWIVPSFENSAWSIMAISFISLLAMSAVLATCFFVRRHRIRRDRPRAPRVREFHGMSSRLVKAMPSLIFTSVLEDNCTSITCAICLEDYNVGEKLRVLPCRHKFHALCVDLWLTSWRTFCPVCKRDARTSTGEPPASESTPLLSSAPVSATSSASALSYYGSSIPSSSAIQIHSPSAASRAMSASSRAMSASISNSYLQNSLRSYRQSPTMHVSRSTSDLRNASASRSHVVSPHSLGYPYPSSSPFNSQYMSPYMPSPSNNSASYMGSSHHNHHRHPLHYSESAASFSPMASTHSLPEC